MGVNFTDIRYIINWGPARTLLDVHQGAGRAVRDGKQSHIIIIYHGQQLAHCENDVKYFVKTDGCYRVAGYKPFDSNIEPLNVGHNCCSNCSKLCKCDTLDCTSILPFEKEFCAPVMETVTRCVTHQDKKDLEEAFVELSSSMPIGCSVFGAATSHGFSEELISCIVEKCDCLFTLDDINTLLPVFSVNHAVKILEILDDVFGDIPNINFTSQILYEDINTSDITGNDYFDEDILPYEYNSDEPDISAQENVDDDGFN